VARRPFEDELKPRDAVIRWAAARHAVIAAGKHRKLDRGTTRAQRSEQPLRLLERHAQGALPMQDQSRDIDLVRVFTV